MSRQRKTLIYGPVPSRRLGLSLGVDLVPYKTCSYDCIYCQLGGTTDKTIELKDYVPTEEVLADVTKWLAGDGKADYITMSGSGEPTLHSGLGKIIKRIRELTDIPVAVITNGSLLWLDCVAEACALADLVVPSLDAGSAEIYTQVNRPHPDITFDLMLKGLQSFRDRYKGTIWLEVMLVGGVNDSPEQIAAMADFVRTIQPERIQVNTVVRPPTEKYAECIAPEKLQQLAVSLGGDVIAPFDISHTHEAKSDQTGSILELLKRRPCTVLDIASGLGIHENEVVKQLNKMLEEGTVVATRRGENVLYRMIG